LKGVKVDKKEIDYLNNIIKDTEEYKIGKNLVKEMIKLMSEREQRRVDNELLPKV